MALRLHDSWSNWNLETLVFEERGKLEYLEKNLSEQGREPTTNSTHIWHQRWDLNSGPIGGRWVLTPLHHPVYCLMWNFSANCQLTVGQQLAACRYKVSVKNCYVHCLIYCLNSTFYEHCIARKGKLFASTLSMPKIVFLLPIGAKCQCEMKLSHLSPSYSLVFLGTNPHAPSYTNIPQEDMVHTKNCDHFSRTFQRPH